METSNNASRRTAVRSLSAARRWVRSALTAGLVLAAALRLAPAAAAATFEVTGQFQADHNALFIGSTTWQGFQSPGVSAANQGVIYFDTATYHFEVSENGGAYFTLMSGGQLLSSTQTYTGENTFANSVTLVNSSITLTGSNVGVYIGANFMSAAGFGGNGAALTNLNAGALTTGIINSALLPSTVAYTSNANTFTSSQTFSAGLSAGNSRITNLAAPVSTSDAVNLGTVNTATAAAAAYAISQATSAASASVTGTTNTFTAAQTFNNTATFNSSATFNGALGAGSESIANTLNVGGGVTASSFTGNGAALTGLNAGALTTGIVGAALLPSSVAYTSSANTFTSSQTFTNGISAGGRTINNVLSPAALTDAANLGTVNTATAAAAAYAISQATSAAPASVTGTTNTFTAAQTFNNTATFNSSATFNGALGASTETIVNSLTVGGGVTGSVFTGSGAGLTALNATQLTTGSVPYAQLGNAILNQAAYQLGAVFNVSSGTIEGQALLATTGGNVGIGTTAPAHKLVVNSTSEFDVDTSNSYISLMIGGVEVARIKP